MLLDPKLNDKSLVKEVETKSLMDSDTESLMKLIWDPEVFKNAMDEVKIDSTYA